MKKWKCPACKRDRITEKGVIISMCICGEYFKEGEGNE